MIYVWFQPEDRLKRAVEIRREPQRQLDRRDIAAYLEGEDRLSSDLQVAGELLLGQATRLAQIAQAVDDDWLHRRAHLPFVSSSPAAAQRTSGWICSWGMLCMLNVKHT